jgi:hypothetical protein
MVRKIFFCIHRTYNSENQFRHGRNQCRPGEYYFVGTYILQIIHPKKLGVILSIPVLGVFGSFGQKIHLLHTFSQEFPLFRNCVFSHEENNGESKYLFLDMYVRDLS